VTAERTRPAPAQPGARPGAAVRSRPRRAGERHREGFRPDIQGLRAVAVLIVVGNHAGVPYMGGGYVGVDVFFVISGFLITCWLLGRSLVRGRVPFASFYAARARRILPAAALTLVAVCAASALYLNSVRALAAVHDAVWAAFFAANVHFAQVGTNYFAQDNPPSPIQHLWTLAVEEQFYLVWPLLLAVFMALAAGRRTAAPSRAPLALMVGVAVAASFAWSIHQTADAPVAAYFSTAARAWELGVGVLLAVCAPAIARVRPSVRAALAWVGLAGIAVATVAYGQATAFPGDAAALPVLGAALVVAGGIGPAASGGAGALLSRRPLPLIGDTSYAYYLWHWPVLVIVAGYAGHDLSTLQNVGLMVAALVLSRLTYLAFENPLRHADRLRAPGRALLLWPASVAAVLLAVALSSSSLPTYATAAPRLLLGAHASPAAPADAAAISRRVERAVAASVAPARQDDPVPHALVPAVDRLDGDIFPLDQCKGPKTKGGRTAGLCTLGDDNADRVLAVLGDSHVQMWMPGIVRFGNEHHWRVMPFAKSACEAFKLWTPTRCGPWFTWAKAQMRRLHPGAIVVGHFYSGWGKASIAAIGRELRELRALSPRVILLEDPPNRPERSVDCLLARGATLGSCTFPVTAEQSAIYAGVRRQAAAAGAAYVRTRQWLCAGGRCPTVVGNVIVFKDTSHLTQEYVRILARPLASAIARAVSRSVPAAAG
jgi:peptidoglycan/LPS O-acetylase OafA/YrhL